MSANVADAKQIFLQAVENHAPERWPEFLQDACGTDTVLRERVDALLVAYRQPNRILDSSSHQATLELRSITEEPGTFIGPYKLLQQIGEGGMGVVFTAEQTEPLQRTVALKIIKPGMDTRQVIARFEAERQALALMDHPNIAKVLDAGTTDTGRPYFVMELVNGVPITKYCDDNRLTVGQRLALFMQVCQAVQHAHQKGIIHRDIKPNNVLVAEYDNRAVPKVIDFGVAKATAQRLTERTMFTEFGQVLGTMEYMSPEQSKSNQLDIDTRSDIYSLGVLLYELLTGTTPFDRQRLHSAAFDEALRIIREEEPPKPSTRLSSLSFGERAGVRVPSSLPSIAANRHTEPIRLTKEVHGELDWIVMKALEKDRNRRYDTPSGFAADIERHLRNEPVEACPPSTWYRFGKMAKRNKAALITSALLAGMLTASTVISGWQAVRATRASRDAEAARDNEAKLRRQAEASEKKAQVEVLKNQQVARFLEDMLNGVGPRIAQGRDTTVLRDIMEVAAGRIGTSLKDQPDVEAKLRSVMGDVYWSVGEFEKSEFMHRAALNQLRESLGNENLLVADSLRRLALPVRDASKWAEAETLLREALATQQKILGSENDEVAHTKRELAVVLWGEKKFAEAESLSRDALAVRRKLYGDEHLLVADALRTLAGILDAQGKYVEAEPLVRDALAMTKGLNGNSSTMDTALTLETLTDVVGHQNRPAEAEAAAREALDLASKIAGQGSAWTLGSLYRLVIILDQAGEQDELEEVFNTYPVPARGGLKRRRQEMLSIRDALLDQNKELKERVAQMDQFPAAQNLNSPDQAEASWRREVALYDRLARDNPSIAYYRWRLADCHFELASVLQSNGQPMEAEKSYAASVQLAQELASDDAAESNYLQRAVTYHFAFARCLLAMDRLDDAVKVSRKTIDFLDSLTTKQQVDRVAIGDFYFGVGKMLDGLGRWNEAVPAYQNSKAIWEQLAAEFPNVADHRMKLGHAYRLLHDQAKGVAEFSRAIEIWPADVRFLFWRAAGLSCLGQYDRAMADLEEAFGRGYADVAQLKIDQSFDPLRSRDDFKKLLGEIEQGKTGGKVP